MPMRFWIPALLITLLIYACSTPQPLSTEQDALTAPVSQPEPAEFVPESPQEPLTPPAPEAGPGIEAVAPDCLGGETSPIGQSIADDYEFASYEEVITWFCNGAEFEDILVALETESQTGNPAEEMLQMLADGFTWEEIWQLAGLTE